MAFWSRKSAFAHGMSISTRFSLGVGVLLALFLIVAATGYLSVAIVGDAEESIRLSTEIRRLVLEMDRGMEKARRLHGDFFLQYPQIGLAGAHALYAQPSVRQVAQVITASRALRGLLARAYNSAEPRKSDVNLNLYLSSAKRFADTSIQSVELVTRLASPENGLEVQLMGLFASLHAAIGWSGDLHTRLEQMRAFVLDYRIARERHLMQSAFNVSVKLRNEVSGFSAFTDDEKHRIDNLLVTFVETAEEVLAVDVAIKSKFNDFALQARTVEPVSANLLTLADDAVEAARDRIDTARRTAIIVMMSVTLAGLIVAIAIARALTESITRRVTALTLSAGELEKGNLNAVAPEAGNDELSLLARTFNVMAARIRELVDNLEQKVTQRTEALAISEKRFRELFEHSDSGVAIYEALDDGKDFTVMDINKTVERIEGVARQDIIGLAVTEAFPGIEAFGLLDVFRRVWRTGQPSKQPVRYYEDDNRAGWRENAVYKLPSGEIVAIYSDLSSQVQAEVERRNIEIKLQRAQKMEAIGLMAGGVAHDLNNILSGIVGYPELLLMQLPEESDLRAPLRAIQDSGHRAAAVVADLLTVARGVASTKIPASLNAIIDEYLKSPECRRLLAARGFVACETRLATGLRHIDCSPVHIKKCIMNLVTNAVEAIEGEGRILISTRNQRVDEKMAAENRIAPGEFAVLSVSDTGTGISAQDIEHIFEPFYTRKVMGMSGTGLGLSVVWSCVADHGGTVLVESGASGTTFELFFPASGKDIVPEKETQGIATLKGAGQRILVVDDEPQQLDIAARMLTVLGYDAVCVNSGEAAIEYLKTHDAALILLDMLMGPAINGRQTYERILAFRPEQRAVIASGFSETEDVLAARRLGSRGFLKKPYTLEQLGRAIKDGLN